MYKCVFFFPFFLESASGPVTTPVTVPPKPLTSRQQVALELLQTEKNYVEILTNILKVNKLESVPMNYLCDLNSTSGKITTRKKDFPLTKWVLTLWLSLQVFKEPLEKDPRGGSIISAEDIKTIFGRLPGILEVHNKIMVRLVLKFWQIMLAFYGWNWSWIRNLNKVEKLTLNL